MLFKKAMAVVLIIILISCLFGCKAVDVMKDLVSEDTPDVEIVRSDDESSEVTVDANLRNTVLYFQNETGYLVPVNRQIPWEEGIAKAALRNMIDSQAIRDDLGYIGLLPLIPAGTEIKGMSISEDGLCKVDFSKELLNCQSKKEEENLVVGVVYTLTEFPTINEVKFMIEGDEISHLQYGTDVSSAIKRGDINLAENTANANSEVLVYYKGTSNGEYEYYIPVTVPTVAPTSNVFSSLEKLFGGAPASSGLYTDIPDGVYFQGVEVNDGIAYVDILTESADILYNQAIFDRMSRNIGLTLSQFNDIAYVEILIGGKTVEEAGLDVIQPEAMPVFANEY